MTELKKHYITGAAKNAAESLAMAMHLTMTAKPSRYDAMGVQDLVKAVNAAAISLRKACLRQEEVLKSEAHNALLDRKQRSLRRAGISNAMRAAP